MESLVLGDSPKTAWKQLMASPLLASVTELSLGRSLDDDAWAAFLAAPLQRLRSLDLTYATIPAKALRELATSETFSNLRSLLLRGEQSGPSIRALAKSKSLHHLRKLNLSGCCITVEMAKVLGGSVALAELEELDLANNPLGPQGLRNLLGGH